MLATAAGLYKISDVVLDASESNNICFPLNTSYTLVLSSLTAGIEDPSLADGLEEFYQKKQVLGVCLKDNCEAFMKQALNHFYPVDSYNALDLLKEFSLDNLSRNDIFLLREFLQIGVYPPFYINLPRISEVLILNENGSLLYGEKEILNPSLKDLTEFITYAIEKETILDIEYANLISDLNKEITPVYFDKNIDIFNKNVTSEIIINYKKRFINYFKQLFKEKQQHRYLGFNKNALVFADIVDGNKDLFNRFLEQS